MKKNHINFAHPNKWTDSLVSLVESPSVAQRSRRGDERKIKFEKKNTLESPP